MELPTHIVTAAGVVENLNGEILLVRSKSSGWVFPGGIVENGETLIEAVKREVLEETGADIEVKKLFCVSSNTATHKGYNGVKIIPTKVLLDFICLYKGGEIRPSEENPETKWFKKEDVLGVMTEGFIIDRYKAYLSFNGNVQYLEMNTRKPYCLKFNREL